MLPAPRIQPAHPDTPDAESGLRFAKTSAGREMLNGRHSGLGLRDRQVLLLCNGVRTVQEMADIFGPHVMYDLDRLMFLGYVQPAALDMPADFAATLPPLLGARDAMAANATTFEPSSPGCDDSAAEALAAAHAQADVMLAELTDPEATALAAAYRDARREDDVLVFLSAAVGQIARAWGVRQATLCADQLALLLPRPVIARFLDCLIDEVDPQVVTALYETMLSDSEFGEERQGR